MDIAAIQSGAQLHSQGRLDEAESVYLSLMGGPPEQRAIAHHLLGLVMTDRDDVAGALDHFDQAVAAGAASPEIFMSRASLLRRLGRLRDALESYDRAIALEPSDATSRHLRGVVLAALGRTEAAVESYDQAVALDPGVKTYWNNRGVALEAAHRLPEAIVSYDRALALDPDYVQAHHNRGSALVKLDLLEEAAASLEEALARNPNIPESWSILAVAQAKLERYSAALDSSNHALSLRPAYPEAHNTRSVALRALKRPVEALNAADAALSARPGFPEALNSRASALVKLNRYEEACQSYRLALATLPNDAAIHLNLGMALEALGELREAEAAFAKSELLSPHLPDARFARGLVHVRSGSIPEGFRLYETRWTQKGGPRHGFPDDKLWLGGPIGDQTLLVHAEQGFGDVIQFCRFAPNAAAPRSLILRVQPPLKRLLTSLKGVGRLIDDDEATPAYDLHIPIMSLPLALGLTVADLGMSTPYLHPPASAASAWLQRLPATDGLRIGLAWSGNAKHDNDHNRSMALSTLRPLLNEPAQFISLQRDYRREDRALLDHLPQILRFDDALEDFAETAALISCCDVVIAVDTAVAHLAGALGKPLWLLLPKFSDWRWMNDRLDSPWYPSAVLYRQTAFGDWTKPIEGVRRRLRQMAR